MMLSKKKVERQCPTVVVVVVVAGRNHVCKGRAIL